MKRNEHPGSNYIRQQIGNELSVPAIHIIDALIEKWDGKNPLELNYFLTALEKNYPVDIITKTLVGLESIGAIVTINNEYILVNQFINFEPTNLYDNLLILSKFNDSKVNNWFWEWLKTKCTNEKTESNQN